MDPLPPFPWLDVVIILALIVLNGVFAMSELAIVSARNAKLEAMARDGSNGARTALKLGSDPGKFLSTVQIGITLIGILAGAYSGASLGAPVGERLALVGVPADIADSVGFALVIGVTTYLSLVIGELVPKQFALRKAEELAVIMAIPMDLMARGAAPLVWVLDRSSALIFRLLGLNRESENIVTAEELQMIFAEATKSGVIEESERAIISGVVRLADRPVREVMTPRTEVDWLPADAGLADLRRIMADSPHSRLPVASGSVDAIIGIVTVRDLLTAIIEGAPLDLAALARPAPMVPERADGSLLISGGLPADAMAERLGISLPEDRDYATAAGHVLHCLRHLPKEGEVFNDQGWRFEIVDMDNRKVDKLLVSRIAESD